MAKRKTPKVPYHLKKCKGGEANAYLSFPKSRDYLRLTSREFQKIAVLKGVYPREPKHRKKLNIPRRFRKQSVYLKKDLKFIAADPIIWEFYKLRTLRRKLRKAEGDGKEKRLKDIKRLNFDARHIVLQRYPRFKDALADLEDPLCTMFLFGHLPKNKFIDSRKGDTVKKLVSEFQHYIIETRSLRKTFISFKGYYYTANIKGVDITWMVPHPFSLSCSSKYACSLFSDFLDFYIALLQFVNYRLFSLINYRYPLQSVRPINFRQDGSKAMGKRERSLWLTSLNVDLGSYMVGPSEQPLSFDKLPPNQQSRERGDPEYRSQRVFEKMKFFISRECNKESLTFVIRCGGGKVSWDALYGYGSTFTEDDPTITHQICDRPKVTGPKLSRYYIQPQWVYDSFNAGICLPVADYFVGVSLPPHLSPYEVELSTKREAEEGEGSVYKPPEQVKIEALLKKVMIEDPNEGVDSDSDSEFDAREHAAMVDAELDIDEVLQRNNIPSGVNSSEPMSSDEDEDSNENQTGQADDHSTEDSEEESGVDDNEAENNRSDDVLADMVVSKVTEPFTPRRNREQVRKDHKDLTLMTVPKKYRYAYTRLLRTEKRKKHQIQRRRFTRQVYECAQKKLQDKKKAKNSLQKQQALRLQMENDASSLGSKVE